MLRHRYFPAEEAALAELKATAEGILDQADAGEESISYYPLSVSRSPSPKCWAAHRLSLYPEHGGLAASLSWHQGVSLHEDLPREDKFMPRLADELVVLKGCS